MFCIYFVIPYLVSFVAYQSARWVTLFQFYSYCRVAVRGAIGWSVD